MALIVERTTSEEHAPSFYAVVEDKAQDMVDTLQNVSVTLSHIAHQNSTPAIYSYWYFSPKMSKSIEDTC
jgi:hypothetical protein